MHPRLIAVTAVSILVLATVPATASEHQACDRPPTIEGTDADDVLRGTRGPDVIHGLAGNDLLIGLGGDDVLCGGPGDDVLVGGAGDDELHGQAGSDRFVPASGDDLIDGGQGRHDLLDFRRSHGPVVVHLHLGYARGEGADLVSGIEHVSGSRHADALTGTRAANRLEGRGGDDVLRGGPGPDTLIGGGGDDVAIGGPGRDGGEGGRGSDACDAETVHRCEEPTPTHPGDPVACHDFPAWPHAQVWFERYLDAHGDVGHLDNDGDGLACESLRGSP